MSTRVRTPVFSFWAWLILAPPLITIWGGYTTALDPRERLHGLIAAIVVHLVLGACFWLAHLVERRLPTAWCWVWFIAVLAVISVLRPLIADTLQRWSGVHLVPPALGIRVALNLLGIGVVMLIVHFALEQVAHAADSRRRLAAVLRRTEQQQVATDVRHAALILEYQRTIADPIRKALTHVDPHAPPARLAEQLMRLAHDVVRPLADRAFGLAADTTEYQYRPTSEPAPVASRARLATPQRIEASLPGGPVAVWFVMQLPVSILTYDVALGAGITVASTALVLIGCWLVRRHPLPSTGPAAIALLAVEYAAIGALGTLVLVSPDPGGAAIGYWIYGILMSSVTGTILSFARSRQLDYLDTDQELIEQLLAARYQANSAHARLAETTNLLARRLHASIQTDVVAAAFQIRLGAEDPDAIVNDLSAQIERVLDAPMLPTAVDDVDQGRLYADGIRAATRAADQAWCEGLELTTDYDERLWQWLVEHPECRALVREVATKALTNVIRYGRIRRARLRVDLLDDRLRIEVRSPGRILARDERTSGMDAFVGRVSVAEFVQEGPDVVHRVIA